MASTGNNSVGGNAAAARKINVQVGENKATGKVVVMVNSVPLAGVIGIDKIIVVQMVFARDVQEPGCFSVSSFWIAAIPWGSDVLVSSMQNMSEGYEEVPNVANETARVPLVLAWQFVADLLAPEAYGDPRLGKQFNVTKYFVVPAASSLRALLVHWPPGMPLGVVQLGYAWEKAVLGASAPKGAEDTKLQKNALTCAGEAGYWARLMFVPLSQYIHKRLVDLGGVGTEDPEDMVEAARAAQATEAFRADKYHVYMSVRDGYLSGDGSLNLGLTNPAVLVTRGLGLIEAGQRAVPGQRVLDDLAAAHMGIVQGAAAPVNAVKRPLAARVVPDWAYYAAGGGLCAFAAVAILMLVAARRGGGRRRSRYY